MDHRCHNLDCLVLTTMQVGLSTNALKDNVAFHKASYSICHPRSYSRRLLGITGASGLRNPILDYCPIGTPATRIKLRDND